MEGLRIPSPSVFLGVGGGPYTIGVSRNMQSMSYAERENLHSTVSKKYLCNDNKQHHNELYILINPENEKKQNTFFFVLMTRIPFTKPKYMFLLDWP